VSLALGESRQGHDPPFVMNASTNYPPLHAAPPYKERGKQGLIGKFKSDACVHMCKDIMSESFMCMILVSKHPPASCYI